MRHPEVKCCINHLKNNEVPQLLTPLESKISEEKSEVIILLKRCTIRQKVNLQKISKYIYNIPCLRENKQKSSHHERVKWHVTIYKYLLRQSISFLSGINNIEFSLQPIFNIFSEKMNFLYKFFINLYSYILGEYFLNLFAKVSHFNKKNILS